MPGTAVIIAAAGSGSRMGSSVPKQYLNVNGAPMLVKAVEAFCAVGDFQIFVAAGDVPYTAELLEKYGHGDVKVVQGGARRQDSVYNALCQVPPEIDTVLIHDGARPFVSRQVIENVLEGLKTSDGVIPCVQPKSTIRTSDRCLDRSMLYEVQTPQGFRLSAIKEAYEKANKAAFEATDDAGIYEFAFQKPVAIVSGGYGNIKITTKEDMPKEIRTGMGYDVHRLVCGRPLMLACTKLPYELGLLGHSDADVVAHSIADALLGAAAMRDIGYHFPDNDPKYEGMSGSRILQLTADLIRSAGYEIVNIDATLIAEKPKISPYIGEMRENTANALGIEKDKVSIKATTQEGLGFTANDAGMAAMAVANIR